MARVASELTITPLHPHLGARVEGVCLADPPIATRVPIWDGIVPAG